MLKTKPSVEEATEAFSSDDYEIGSGCFRYVHHIPGSYWAYKRNYNNNYSAGNKSEWKAYKKFLRLKSVPAGIYVPEMEMLKNGDLAVQFIEGTFPTERNCYPDYHDCDHEDTCFWTIYGSTLEELVDDMHSTNVVISYSGDIYIIDLGGC